MGMVHLSFNDWQWLYGLRCCAMHGPCSGLPACCLSNAAKKRRAAWRLAGNLQRKEARDMFVTCASKVLHEVAVKSRPSNVGNPLTLLCLGPR